MKAIIFSISSLSGVMLTTGCGRTQCLEVSQPAPIMEQPWSPNATAYRNGIMQTNRVLGLLQPGRYHLEEALNTKSTQGYLVQVGDTTGYLFHTDGVELCRDEIK